MLGADIDVTRVSKRLRMQVAMQVGPEPVELVLMDWYVGQYAVSHNCRTAYGAEVFEVALNRVMIMITHDQPLHPVQPRKRFECGKTKQDIPKMPDGVTLLDRVVPPIHKFVVMLLNVRKRTCFGFELTDALVAKMRVGNDKDAIWHASSPIVFGDHLQRTSDGIDSFLEIPFNAFASPTTTGHQKLLDRMLQTRVGDREKLKHPIHIEKFDVADVLEVV